MPKEKKSFNLLNAYLKVLQRMSYLGRQFYRFFYFVLPCNYVLNTVVL